MLAAAHAIVNGIVRGSGQCLSKNPFAVVTILPIYLFSRTLVLIIILFIRIVSVWYSDFDFVLHVALTAARLVSSVYHILMAVDIYQDTIFAANTLFSEITYTRVETAEVLAKQGF